jgi:8-oxo-dGTP pyrophosphatase MutT (NUDIX family)
MKVYISKQYGVSVFVGILYAIFNKEVIIKPGKIKTFEYSVRPPGTRILAVDNTQSEPKYLLTLEKRISGDDIRLPGGKVWDTFGEFAPFIDDNITEYNLAKEGACKELHEETGYRVEQNNLELIDTQYNGDNNIWTLYYFTVNITEDNYDKQHLEAGENIEPKLYTKSEILELIKQNKIHESRTRDVLRSYFDNL